LKAYKDPIGVLTIGYGHTSAAGEPLVKEGMTITQDEAEAILKRDLVKYEIPVGNLVKVNLNQNQFDVLVDFAYNAGVGNLKTSTLLKKVNAGDFDAVPDELMKWTKGGGKVLPGLVRRRRAEADWWNDGEDQAEDSSDQALAPDTVPVKTITDSKQANGAMAVGLLGSVGAVKDAAYQLQDANDVLTQVTSILKSTNFLIMIAIIGISAAIWYWRKKHLEEHGV
jgi:GH24 family phage-related lysozyme (muramidase)